MYVTNPNVQNEDLLKCEIRFNCKEHCPEMCSKYDDKFHYHDAADEDDEWVADTTIEINCSGKLYSNWCANN